MKYLSLLFMGCLLAACNTAPPKETDAVAATTFDSVSVKPLDAQTTDSVHIIDEAMTQAEIVPAATVLPNVSATTNPSAHYALYKPAKYETAQEKHALILFDPHGDGSFPLKLYKALADEYGILLLGSNDARNNSDTRGIADALVTEAKESFGATHVSLGGFSGGAKVALQAAQNAHVRDIVYCGAATQLGAPRSNLRLLGLTGKRDMNYTELIDFDRSLPANVSHTILEHDGKHEWPSAKVMRNAFVFISNSDAKRYTISAPSITPQQVEEEQSIKQALMEKFRTHELSDWKVEVAKMRDVEARDVSGRTSRMLGFISLACYSMSNRALQKSDWKTAEHLLNVYELADPKNSDCYLLRAQFYAKQNQNGKALDALKKAVNVGLKDAAPIEREPSFAALRNDAQYQALIAALRK